MEPFLLVMRVSTVLFLQIIQRIYLHLSFIESIKGFKKLDLKYSQSQKKPFVRLKVKLKKEIVTIGDQSINPNEDVGEYVNA